VEPFESLALIGREIGDTALLEPFVPALARFRRHTLGDGSGDLDLVAGAADQFDELRRGEACLAQQQHAQARRDVVVAEVAAGQRGACLVHRARQEHEAREPGARIARRAPAQADRAHEMIVDETSENFVRPAEAWQFLSRSDICGTAVRRRIGPNAGRLLRQAS
jgi:hypothetical protein